MRIALVWNGRPIHRYPEVVVLGLRDGADPAGYGLYCADWRGITSFGGYLDFSVSCWIRR